MTTQPTIFWIKSCWSRAENLWSGI